MPGVHDFARTNLKRQTVFLMKTQKEIQRAHDCLIGIFVGDAPTPYAAAEDLFKAFMADLQRSDPALHEAICFEFLKANADVLCWVLDHDHNTKFRDNMAKLEQWLREHGRELRDWSN